MRIVSSLLLSATLFTPLVVHAGLNAQPSIKGVELGMNLDEMVSAFAESGFVQKADMSDVRGADVAVGDILGHYSEVNSGKDGLGSPKRWGFKALFEKNDPDTESDGPEYITVELAPDGSNLRVASIQYMMMLRNHVEQSAVHAALRKASGPVEPTCDDAFTSYILTKKGGLVRQDCDLVEDVGLYTLGVDERQNYPHATDISYTWDNHVLLDEEGLVEAYSIWLYSFEHSWPAMQAAKNGEEWQVPVPEFEVNL